MATKIAYIPQPDASGFAKYSAKFNGNPVQVVANALGYDSVESFPDNDFTGSIEDSLDSERVYTSIMGNPIFMPLLFEATPYEYTDPSDGSFVSTSTSELFVPMLIIEMVSREKNLGETIMEGASGEVFEYGGHKAHVIRIKGVLVGDDEVQDVADKVVRQYSTAANYPTTQKIKLIEIENAPVSIAVSCDFLSFFGISDLMVKRVSFTPMIGYEDCLAFEMECKSDRPVKLNLDDEIIID